MNGRAVTLLLLPALICLPTPMLAQTESPSKVVAAAPGRIEGSSDMISIGAAVNGTVERVELQQGDRVTSGQTLIRIVCDDLKARLAQRVADRQATEAYYRKRGNGARR